MNAGVGKWERRPGSGFTITPSAGRVARPAGDYVKRSGEQVWCYVCDEAHRYHGRTPLGASEREAIV